MELSSRGDVNNAAVMADDATVVLARGALLAGLCRIKGSSRGIEWKGHLKADNFFILCAHGARHIARHKVRPPVGAREHRERLHAESRGGRVGAIRTLRAADGHPRGCGRVRRAPRLPL